MTKHDATLLLGWAQKTKQILDNSGEGDFKELRRKEKQEIFDALIDTGLKYKTDGDCDGAYMSCDIDNVLIQFGAHSESYYPNDMRNALDYMTIEIDYDDISPDNLIAYLEDRMAGDVKMVNLTPHAVTFYADNGERVKVVKTIPSSGVARAEQTREPLGDINGIPVSRTAYGKVTGLPDPQDGTVYIVSVLTAQAARGRDDLYIVDDLVRDDAGQILGCKALAQI